VDQVVKLPDEFVQQLVEDFENSGKAHAYARAKLKGLEEGRKMTKAALMNVARDAGITASARQESYAYSHPRYKEIVDELVKAVERESLLHYECRLCEIKFEAWRSINANERQASR